MSWQLHLLVVGTTTTVPWQRKSSFISLSTQRVDDRSNPLFSQRHPIRDFQTYFANNFNEFQYVNSHNLPQNKRKQKQLSDFGQSHVSNGYSKVRPRHMIVRMSFCWLLMWCCLLSHSAGHYYLIYNQTSTTIWNVF